MPRRAKRKNLLHFEDRIILGLEINSEEMWATPKIIAILGRMYPNSEVREVRPCFEGCCRGLGYIQYGAIVQRFPEVIEDRPNS